jgi:hypothetical protein
VAAAQRWAGGKQWQAGLVVHRGRKIERMSAAHLIWSVPVHRLLGACRPSPT